MYKFFAAAMATLVAGQAAEPLTHQWETRQLTSEFWAEGAHFGDFNRDGHNDIVSGPYWYEGPSFEKRHEYYPAAERHKQKREDGAEIEAPGFDPLHYSRNFLAYTYDFNQDGWLDILILGFPGEESSWYENLKGKEGHWPRHVILKVTDNESPTFGDLTGDGKPEIICNSEGYFGYAEPDWSDPTKLFKFHRISPKGPWQRFTHGLGYGDVNGDGRQDILEKDGWWEQPAKLDGTPWKKHDFTFSQPGGSQMYAYDVDGDGDNDVITALHAHGYGLAWYEHIQENGAITFKPRIIINEKPEENAYGVKFSQLHSVDLVDMDNDGLKDIVTGKRWWAHGPSGDAEPNAPAVVYWFKLTRGPQGVEYIPFQIHDNSGVGTQVIAGKINKDQWPDVVVGNKKGTFVHLHKVEKVSPEEHLKAQPKKITSAQK